MYWDSAPSWDLDVQIIGILKYAVLTHEHSVPLLLSNFAHIILEFKKSSPATGDKFVFANVTNNYTSNFSMNNSCTIQRNDLF